MRTTLICLHGFTQNGAVMRANLQELRARLPGELNCEFPDALHTCSAANVERIYSFPGAVRLPPPYLYWWNATDDGLEYHGWEETRDQLEALVSDAERVGVLGFSQGANVAAAISALAECDEFPRVAFAILIAGRAPRSTALKAAVARGVHVPSLHVWGERDTLARTHSAALVERFDPATRQVVVWPAHTSYLRAARLSTQSPSSSRAS
jgi:pimeloyl-ACP methyl ester carboxylesterase